MEKQADDYGAVGEAAKESQSEKVASIKSVSRQPDELEFAGLVGPTEEELNTLRHVPDKVDWSAYSKCLFHISPFKHSPSTSLTQFRSDCLCRIGRTLLRKSPVFVLPFRELIVSLHSFMVNHISSQSLLCTFYTYYTIFSRQHRSFSKSLVHSHFISRPVYSPFTIQVNFIQQPLP